MKEELLKIKEEAKKSFSEAKSLQDLYELKSRYLGKKSKISEVMKSMYDLSVEEKKEIGKFSNEIKNEINVSFEEAKDEIYSRENKLEFDATEEVKVNVGSLHPRTIIENELIKKFKSMGFIIVDGPEVEDDYHNFEALNIPKTHPARDMQDTYWLSDGKLLRTHTSCCQIRGMKEIGAPLKIVAPGRVFRNEDIDANHENTFFQFEGMVIDENISIANLIHVMKELLSSVFERDVEVRLRPGFFPFVEPGFELDINCLICGGKGCPTCKGSGWLELCPCGMVHPNVLKEAGIDTEKYNGFAFGLGLDRLVMMKYLIKDIRLLNGADVSELKKFGVE